MSIAIDRMKAEDWDRVSQIYLAGIKTEKATFQEEVPSWEAWDKSHCKSCRLVARLGDTIVGWAAISPTSSRCVYAGVGEVSIYIDENYRAQGIGKKLLLALVSCSEENGYWTLQAGIIEENKASIEMHRRCGFRVLGIREKIGKMFNGKWHNVVIMERRSQKVGIE